MFQLLSALIELQLQEFTTECRAKNKDVVEMIDKQIRMSLNSHQDGVVLPLVATKSRRISCVGKEGEDSYR